MSTVMHQHKTEATYEIIQGNVHYEFWLASKVLNPI